VGLPAPCWARPPQRTLLAEHPLDRRSFLALALAAGVLSSASRLWPSAASGASPLGLEEATQGRLRPGLRLSKENAAAARELLTPGTWEKIQRFGLEFPLVETTFDRRALVPREWLEATEHHRGQAVLDGHQLQTRDGRPWIGGTPFPEPQSGLEAAWNLASQAWIEYADDFLYTGGEHLISRGEIERTLRWVFGGIATVGRIGSGGPWLAGHEKELYRLVLRYTWPFDIRGTSVLVIRPYDQRQVERAFVYLPALRRVRQVPTRQRWESVMGNDIFRSDQNGHNDPLAFWDWRLLGTRPFLLPAVVDDPPVDPVPAVAGRFPEWPWELRPAVHVLEAIPRDPLCPYSRKLLYLDAAMGKAIAFEFYDRRGELWKAAVHHQSRVHGKDGWFLSLAYPNHCTDLQADHVTFLWTDGVEKNAGRALEELWTVEALLRVAE
jgi:hypothetical protein